VPCARVLDSSLAGAILSFPAWMGPLKKDTDLAARAGQEKPAVTKVCVTARGNGVNAFSRCIYRRAMQLQCLGCKQCCCLPQMLCAFLTNPVVSAYRCNL